MKSVEIVEPPEITGSTLTSGDLLPDRKPLAHDRDLSLGVAERVGLMRDGLLNYAGYVVSGVVGALLVPLLLRGLGAESYGVWAVAVTASALASSILDFGLYYTIARQVVARGNQSDYGEATRVVVAGGAAYLAGGLFGAVVISALGIPIIGLMPLSTASRKIGKLVFFLTGLSFLGGQLTTYSGSVLRGLRRFDLLSAITAGTSLLWGAGVIVALRANAGLVTILTWQVAWSAIAALIGLETVARLEPGLRLRLRRPEWHCLKNHLGFSLASQLSSMANALIWDMGPILIGSILGAAQVVPYYIGRKGPTVVSWLTWHTSEVLFFAASDSPPQEQSRARDIIGLGTRWNLLLAVPLCVTLWVSAPALLRAWLGEADSATVSIMRLITVAIVFDAVAMPSLNVLWGRGQAGALLAILVPTAVISAGLTICLLPRIGVAGAGWAAVAASSFEAVIVLQVGAASAGSNLLRSLLGSIRPLMAPILACATVGFLVVHLIEPNSLPSVAGVASVIGSTYYVIVWLCGVREEETAFIENVVASCAEMFRRLRHQLSGDVK